MATTETGGQINQMPWAQPVIVTTVPADAPVTVFSLPVSTVEGLDFTWHGIRFAHGPGDGAYLAFPLLQFPDTLTVLRTFDVDGVTWAEAAEGPEPVWFKVPATLYSELLADLTGPAGMPLFAIVTASL